MNGFMMDIAKSIRVGIARLNKNKAWLAKELGVSKQYVSAICSGVDVPSTDRIQELARLFNVDVSVFIGWGE